MVKINRAVRLSVLLAVIGIFAGGAVREYAHGTEGADRYVKNQVVVKFRSLPSGLGPAVQSGGFGVLSAGTQNLFSRHRITGLRRVFSDLTTHSNFQRSAVSGKTVAVPDLYGWCVLDVASGEDPAVVAADLAQDPNVAAAHPNYISHISDLVPNDPFFSSQWHHKNTGQTGGATGADIKSTLAWPNVTGSTATIVAVLDTGIETDHQDLMANLLGGFNFIANNNITEDDQGHGTHVAGIIGARGNNNTFVTGVMWQGSLLPVKVCDSTGACTNDASAAGIRYAANHGARVINMSYGGATTDQLETDALAYAASQGVVLVAAAGNNGDEVKNYPAADPNVIAVAATDESDHLAAFSTRGGWITLSAPGNNIVSTFLGNSTASLSGTSMASPMVAGAAGLILSRFPNLGVSDVRSRLTLGSDNIDSLNPTVAGKMGAGRLNLLKATAVIPTVSSIITTISPNASFVQNNSIVNFTASISSDIAPPTVTITVVDQNSRPLTTGVALNYTLTGQTSVTGSVQVGNLTLNYPLASSVKLRFTLNDGVFTNVVDAAVLTLNEQAALPAGGNASVYNPVFNPTQGGVATVRLNLAGAGHVKIQIFTPNGILVKKLADQDVAGAGIQTWDWTGANDRGSVVASGMYLVNISAPGINATKKAIVIK